MANGLLDYLSGFGSTPPEYLGGLLGQEAVDKLKGRAATTGIANAVLGYLAAPKNQNLGLGRIIGQSLQAGMTGAQGVYDNATQDYMTQQKIAEMQRQQKQQAAQDLFRSRIGQPNATRDVMTQDTMQVPVAQGTEAPSFQTQLPAPTVTKQQYFDPKVMMNEALQSGALPFEKYLELSAKEKVDSPFGKIDPAKFTQESVAKFNATGRYEDLIATPPNPNSFIESYEYAVSKGYKGKPEDWQKLSVVAAQQFQEPYKQTEQQATQAATDYRYKRPQNISVTAGGKVFYFPDQQSADAFRAQTKPKARK
jgi:hypothetical protein